MPQFYPCIRGQGLGCMAYDESESTEHFLFCDFRSNDLFLQLLLVATMFQPSEVAENLKRSGGYVPGVRPGKPAADFLDFTMTRLTFAGALSSP